jgi:ketosteroid isomerase-like protein
MAATAETAPFDEAEIVATLQSLVAILEDPDPRERARAYTQDATFVMPGAPPVQGREEMLQRLETATVLRSVTVTPHKIEGRHDLAYAYGLFSGIRDGSPLAMRFLMVLRKEPDGVWRIAREFLAAESPSTKADAGNIKTTREPEADTG